MDHLEEESGCDFVAVYIVSFYRIDAAEKEKTARWCAQLPQAPYKVRVVEVEGVGVEGSGGEGAGGSGSVEVEGVRAGGSVSVEVEGVGGGGERECGG